MIRSPLMQRQLYNSSSIGRVDMHNERSTRLTSQDRLDGEDLGQQPFLQFNSSQSMDTPIKQLITSPKPKRGKQNIESDFIPSILRAAADKRNQLVINVPIQSYNSSNKQNISPHRVNDEKDLCKIEVKQQSQQLIGSDQHLSNNGIGENISDNDDMLLFGHGLQTISQGQQHQHSTILSQQQLPSSKTQQLIQSSKIQQYPPNKQVLNTQLLQPPSLSLKDFNNKLQPQKNKRNKVGNKLSTSISQSVPSTRFETYLNATRTPSMILKFFNPSSLAKPKLLFSHNQSPYQQSDIYPRCQLKASRESILTKKQLKLTLANNLDKILFRYSGGHARVLYNNKLKIKNDSPVTVEVKILCTSPSHYDVKPVSDIVMSPSQIMNFVIEMKLYLHDLDHATMKHDLQRYRGDMFKICYWPTEYSPEIEYEEGERVLPVVIEDTEQQKIRNQGLMRSEKDEQMKIVQTERSIQMYRKMISRNEEMMSKMELQIKEVVKKKFYVKYFTKNIFWTIAVIGVIIGWWLG